MVALEFRREMIDNLFVKEYSKLEIRSSSPKGEGDEMS